MIYRLLGLMGMYIETICKSEPIWLISITETYRYENEMNLPQLFVANIIKIVAQT